VYKELTAFKFCMEQESIYWHNIICIPCSFDKIYIKGGIDNERCLVGSLTP